MGYLVAQVFTVFGVLLFYTGKTRSGSELEEDKKNRKGHQEESRSEAIVDETETRSELTNDGDLSALPTTYYKGKNNSESSGISIEEVIASRINTNFQKNFPSTIKIFPDLNLPTKETALKELKSAAPSGLTFYCHNSLLH